MERISVKFINGVEIFAEKNESGEIFVPVKPICEAIGVDHSAQVKRIKRHYIYSSTMVTVTTVGADEKPREMLSLPLRYTYGWVLSIDADQVLPSIRETVIRYQVECHDALYYHFVGEMMVQIESNKTEIALLEEINSHKKAEKEHCELRKVAEKKLDQVRKSRLSPAKIPVIPGM